MFNLYNGTNMLEPIACVKINVLTELNMVNLTVDLDFRRIFSAHRALSLIKLKLLVLDIDENHQVITLFSPWSW